MIKDFFKALKLFKYSNSLVPNVLACIILYLFGLYLMFFTVYAPFGVAFLILGPSLIAMAFCSLTVNECVAASPRRYIFDRLIPDAFLMFSLAAAYMILNLSTALIGNEATEYYHYEENEYLFTNYYLCLMAMLSAVIVIRLMHRAVLHIAATVFIGIFAIQVLAYQIVNDLLDLSFLYDISDTRLYVRGLVVIILCATIYFVIKPFNKLALAKTHTRKKKPTKNITWVKNVYRLALGLVIIATLIVGGKYIIDKRQNADGMLNFSTINEEYQNLMKDCGDQKKIGEFTITLEKKYYDAITMDGCCLFTIEVPKEYSIKDQIELNSSNLYMDINLYNKDTDSTDDTLRLMVDGNGYVNMDYNSDFQGNKISVYIYMNLLPETSETGTVSAYITASNSHGGYEFDLGNNSDAMYLIDDTCTNPIAVSRTSVVVYENLSPYVMDLSLETTDGSITLVDNELAEGIDKFENGQCEKYIFNQVIDISKVTGIKLEIANNQYDQENMAATCSNSYMEKTFDYYVEDSKAYVTLTFKWTKMPKYRETDFILIDWLGLDFAVDCRINQKLYVTNNNGNTILADDKTVSYDEVYCFDSDMAITDYNKPLAKLTIFPNSFERDAYYDRLIIFPEIYEDNAENSTYEQIITVYMTFNLIGHTLNEYAKGYGVDYPRIGYTYYHHTTDITGKTKWADLTDTLTSGPVGRRFVQILK